MTKTYYFIIKYDEANSKNWTSREFVTAKTKKEACEIVVAQWIEYAKNEMNINPINVRAIAK